MRKASIAILGIAPLFLVPPARASESYDECRTRTARSTRLGLSTVRGPDGKDRIAVDLLPGETLCLAGIERGPGGLHLVDRAPLTEAVELRLESGADDSNRPSLSVRHHNYAREVEYTMGFPVGGTTEIVVSERGSASPGAPQYHWWPRSISRLVLFDFASVPRTVQLHSHSEPGFLALSFVSAFQFSAIDDVNAEFERNGFSTVSGVQPYLGLGLDASLSGFRPNLDFTGGFNRAGGERAPEVDQVMIALSFGYAFYRREGLELFPMLGITGGDVGVEVRSDNPALAFSDLSPGEQRIRRNVSLLMVSLGADFRHELWPTQQTGLILALRAGYGHQFWSGGWVQEERTAVDLRGGPEVDTSGPFVRFALGVFTH